MQKEFRILGGNYNWQQITTHVSAWLPAVYLIVAYLSDNLTVNPIQELTKRSGYFALILLVLSLACTPAHKLFGWRFALKIRRPLGLYTFLYAFAHFLTFAGLDYGFDLDLLPEAIFEKPFILLGATALLILLALAATSFRWWMKRLGKNWKRLHRLIYLAAPLVIIHFAWSQKGDVLRLQGDILQPLVFGLIVVFLLVIRIPGIRRQLSGLRQTATKTRKSSQIKKQPGRFGKSSAES